MTTFHISLVGRKNLSGEIYRQIRRAVLDRRLRPGDPLPPGRELARTLAVSRATVTVVYERLAAEGFVTSRQGSGTFISELVVPAGREKTGRRSTGVLQPRQIWEAIAHHPHSSRFGSTFTPGFAMLRCFRTGRGGGRWFGRCVRAKRPPALTSIPPDITISGSQSPGT
ncbi:winged helix-turn-helix domain-containing protein [Mesorhizobium sp. B263B1A]|uniref:GntR family transcriptional regulator n=1 Tax=Mesorhizobium sp. B263B1A TaxID=2876670 RepID=UPI001AEEE0FE|nr:winged helix-turn-helix domain-containing protein [Mesorhizobium sp. B263B1A]